MNLLPPTSGSKGKQSKPTRNNKQQKLETVRSFEMSTHVYILRDSILLSDPVRVGGGIPLAQ
jgi:hypothetical protein